MSLKLWMAFGIHEMTESCTVEEKVVVLHSEAQAEIDARDKTIASLKSVQQDVIDGALSDVSDQLVKARAEIDRLRAAEKAYKELCACYRIGKNPSEALWKRLEEADEALKADRSPLGSS